MLPGLKYVQAPAGWSCTDGNPFTPDGSYSSDWSGFCVLDRNDDQFYTGRSKSGLFSARFGRKVNHLQNRLADFLRYENAHGRTVILSFPDDINMDEFVSQALSSTPEADVVRPTDPEIVVHSTTCRAWAAIRRGGELKASSRLRSEAKLQRTPSSPSSEMSEIEQYYASEPPEYADYVMFSEIDSTTPEKVVASCAQGRFILEDDAVYEPGVRLYFDNHRIIVEGLGTRDGLHTIKVHSLLPLSPYLITAIGVADIDLEDKRQAWSIRTFVEETNKVFWQRAADEWRKDKG